MKAKKFAKKIRKIMDTLTSDFEPGNYLIFSDAYESVAEKIQDAAVKLRRLSDRLEIEGRADAVAHIASYLEPMESISELMMEHHPDEWFSNAEAQAANAVMGHSFDIETPPTGKWATSFFVYGPKPDPVATPEYWGNPGVSPDTIISDIRKMLGAVSTSAIPDTMGEALFKFEESQKKLSDRIDNFYSAALRKGLELRSELQAENALKMMRENTKGQSHFEAFLLSKLAKALNVGNTDAASNTPASRPERGDEPGSKDDIAVPVIARDLSVMIDRMKYYGVHPEIIRKYDAVLRQHYEPKTACDKTPPVPTDD